MFGHLARALLEQSSGGRAAVRRWQCGKLKLESARAPSVKQRELGTHRLELAPPTRDEPRDCTLLDGEHVLTVPLGRVRVQHAYAHRAALTLATLTHAAAEEPLHRPQLSEIAAQDETPLRESAKGW